MSEWFSVEEWTEDTLLDEVAVCEECSLTIEVGDAEPYDDCPVCGHEGGEQPDGV